MDPSLIKLAEQAVEYARKQGANEVAAGISRGRFLELKRREGRTETLQASTSRGLSIALYVDGRFSSNSTSFLQEDEVKRFIDESLAMTRKLAVDPHRALPDPSLYGPTQGIELDLVDSSYDDLTMERRIELVTEVEDAALAAGEAIISATSEMVTMSSESLQLHSNGFRGERSGTRFYLGASVTARDAEDRRPEDSWWTSTRHLEDIPSPTEIGKEASRRALARIGSRKVASEKLPLVIENRAAGRMVGSLLEPLSGSALQQHRSCFEDKVGCAIASARLNLVDNPLVVRGLGSRTFDGEGLAARDLPVVTAGTLNNYFIDVYYGRKLGLPPTTASSSNLVLALGERDLAGMIKDLNKGILVTSFLGGNANPATGDFSFGVSGFLIKDGALAEPVNEMNITDNHTSLWHRLEEVGNDPMPYGAWRIPALLFSDVQFSGL